MSCPDKQILSAWMDNELKETEAERITNHVNSCSECKRYINSQKLLETVWREGWQDPAKKDFEQMRDTLKQNSPSKKWWKSERTWYVAAVICAAYLGVKIFVLDNAGTSLSEIAISETYNESVPGSPVSHEQEESVFEAEIEIVEEVSIPIESEDEEIGDDIAGLLEESEAEEEEIVFYDLQAVDLIETSSSVDGSTGVSSGYSTTAYGSGGLAGGQSGGETGEVGISSNRLTEGSSTEFSIADSPTLVSSGDVGSTVSTVTGGGGSGSVSIDQSFCGGSVASPEECCDEEIFDVSMQTEYAEADADDLANRDRQSLKNCSVQVVLSSGTIASVSPSFWPSLFDLLESILENNPLFENSEIMLLVDETGAVTGPGIENDAVVELPDQSYSDCVIHIHF